MRTAIDRYKDFCDRGMIPIKLDTLGYPPTLKTLVKGVPLKGSGVRYKLKIPADPMTTYLPEGGAHGHPAPYTHPYRVQAGPCGACGSGADSEKL